VCSPHSFASSIWYKWQAPRSGVVRFVGGDTDFSDGEVRVYADGSSVSSLKQVSSAGGVALVSANAVYAIQVLLTGVEEPSRLTWSMPSGGSHDQCACLSPPP
jgi:hypothetical protein